MSDSGFLFDNSFLPIGWVESHQLALTYSLNLIAISAQTFQKVLPIFAKIANRKAVVLNSTYSQEGMRSSLFISQMAIILAKSKFSLYGCYNIKALFYNHN